MPDFTHSTPLFRAEDVRELDSIAIHRGGIPGIQLMKRAGRAAFEQLCLRWPECESVVVCCGGGNNAGDGYVLAALAAQRRMPVRVLAAVAPDKLANDAKLAWQFAVQERVPIDSVSDWSECLAGLTPETVIVDALLGTGLKGEVRDAFRAAIQAVNNSKAAVLAIDIPSGLHADTGCVLGEAIRADLTMTFVGEKRGLYTGAASAHRGDVLFDDLLISNTDETCLKALAEVPVSAYKLSSASLSRLPARVADDHKGRFGHVMLIGGDSGFGGAIILASETCARAGAGLTSVATRSEHIPAILARRPELMAVGIPSGQALKPLLDKPSVIAIGPGLGRTPWSEQMLQQAAKRDVPLVVDADALNIIAEGRVITAQTRSNWVLTPHPGEAARLLGISVAEVQADRFQAVKQLQAKYGGVVVLKGPGTLIADGDDIFLADVGNPAMATGGMGDVLTGLIAALLAQGLSLCDAACLGVWVHGRAADLAVEEQPRCGLMASDLIPFIRQLLESVDE